MAKQPKSFAKSAQKFRNASRFNPLVRVYEQLVRFDVAALFSTKHTPGPPRSIFFHRALPKDYFNRRGKVSKDHVFISNQVITSKYNLFTFIPRNLLEQFRRIANIFFLGIAILQFFPEFSTVNPGVVILPLAFIVFVTALKDGYEDYQRHQSDRNVNHSVTKVLSSEGGWKNPNHSKSKTKTFTRRLMLSRAPKVGKREHDFDYDSEPPGKSEAYGSTRPHWRRTLWEDVRVGDFVKLHDKEAIPADILICATSEEENVAFVETKNLDGETNLKSRNAVSNLTDLRTAADCVDSNHNFSVSCDRPDNNMYRLNATVERDGQKAPADLQTVLLRGTVLRNTEWVIGVVLFTGEDTKIMLNSGGTPSKRSKVERQMNPQVLFNLLILAIMCMACGIGDSSLQKIHYPQGALWLYGGNTSNNNPSINGLITFAFALLTFQNIIPISLYVSIEVVKTLQSAWIYFDYDIYYSKTDRAAIPKSWNLSDDLGQIEYILSDKTGTLTQNVMVFRQCSIGGVIYKGDNSPYSPVSEKNPEPSSSSSGALTENGVARDHNIPRFHDSRLDADIEHCFASDADQQSAAHARHLNGFFTVLSLCHTVLTSTDPKSGAITYKAQSPDEQALVQAAADVGFVYKGRDSDLRLTLATPLSETDEKYELLNILEFSSARKRMSVIVRQHDAHGGGSRVMLLCKGADNVILERLKSGNDDMKRDTEQHLAEFANEGLRTLTLAYKIIAEEEYAEWNAKYHAATVALDDREEQVEAVSDAMERNLRLLGATAIEDRLQDGVPEAIADLKLAGIKIWVLTGDKLETAIAIGRSTNLIAENNNLIVLRGHSKRPLSSQLVMSFERFFPDHDHPELKDSESRSGTPNQLRRVTTGTSSIVGPDNGSRPGGMILVIDGAGLLEVFESDEDKDAFLRLAMLCEGVICCRVSPLQKALVTKLVKNGLGAMTLAIGDGANDVSMIQAADVGVGIAGEEGLQATNSADYAIAQFRFLKKLLLVHGHWSYARNGTMITTFFYKNIIAVGILWWFQIYCGWSASYVFSYYYLLLWNSVWTLLPCVGIGLFDRVADYHDLMDYPELYRYGREGTWYNQKIFWIYMIDGFYQSVVVFFFICYTYLTSTPRQDGYDVAQAEFSTAMAVSSVIIACIFTGFAAAIWTGWHFFAVYFGIVVVWVFTGVYSAVSPSSSASELYGVYYYLFTSPYFWLSLPLTFVVSVMPRYFFLGYKFIFNPGDLELVRVLRKKDPGRLYDLRYQGAEDGPYSDTFSPDKPNLGMTQMRPTSSAISSRRTSRTSLVSGPQRPSLDVRSASRTDMSTGLTSVERGFGFAMEEAGAPHLRRVQTDLSERRIQRGGLVHRRENDGDRTKGKGSIGKSLSMRLRHRLGGHHHHHQGAQRTTSTEPGSST